MPSSYSTTARFELMADGEKVGTWGQITNRNIGSLVEQLMAGTSDVTLADVNYALAQAYGTTTGDEARSAVISVTGTLTATRNIQIPTAPKLYIFLNATTGGHSITVGMEAGLKATIPNGVAKWVICNGANCWALDDNINVPGLAVIGTLMAGDATVVDLHVTDDATIDGDLTVTGAIHGTADVALDSDKLENKTLAEIKSEIATDYNAAIGTAIDGIVMTREDVTAAINGQDATKPGIKDIAVYLAHKPENGTFSILDFADIGITATEISIVNEVGTGPGSITGTFSENEFNVTIVGATADSKNFKSTFYFWRSV